MLRFAVTALIVAGFGLAGTALAAARDVGIAIVDFAYIDTSGEPADQTAVHQKRLRDLMSTLRRGFSADSQFHLIAVSCGSMPCTGDRSAPDLLHAAADAGAKILVIGGIHKQSTLIQWARIQAIDVAADRVVVDKLFTFRGDNDEAWDRAEAFVFREVRTALEALQPPSSDHPAQKKTNG